MPSLATWFTPSLQGISRASGRSSVAAAAYRACTKLHDERTGETHDYTPKAKHGLAENICIGIPNSDISKLWNDAEKADSRKNSKTARELMTPLPCDWTDAQRRECVRDIAQHLRNEYGVAVMASIHRPGRKSVNDHGHILFTTRKVDEQGNFGSKTRLLDEGKTNGEIKKLREAVCEIVNTHARTNGSDWYVYAGKFSDILEDHIPTKHISISHGKNQKQYIDANRENVKQAQAVITKTKADIALNDEKIAKLTAQATLEESRQNAALASDISEVVPVEAHVSKIDLKRIEMPEEARKAKEQLDKVIRSRAMLRQQYTAWEEMHTQLIASPPVPEYGFFGRAKARYKEALAEYADSMKSATDEMHKCTAKAQKLVEYIRNPDRQRLYRVHQETIAHNALVEAHEKQMAQQREQEVARLEHEHAKREQEANRVDWSAYLRDRQEKCQEKATEYNSGGMGF